MVLSLMGRVAIRTGRTYCCCHHYTDWPSLCFLLSFLLCCIVSEGFNGGRSEVGTESGLCFCGCAFFGLFCVVVLFLYVFCVFVLFVLWFSFCAFCVVVLFLCFLCCGSLFVLFVLWFFFILMPIIELSVGGCLRQGGSFCGTYTCVCDLRI